MPCDYPSLTGPIRDRKTMDPIRALTGHHGPRATYKQIVRTFEIRWGRHDCLRSVCLRLFPNPAQHHHGPVRFPHVSVWFPPVYRTESVRFLRSRDQKTHRKPKGLPYACGHVHHTRVISYMYVLLKCHRPVQLPKSTRMSPVILAYCLL